MKRSNDSSVKMGLNLSPILDTHTHMCLLHIWLCSVCPCKYRSTKQLQKSLDLLKLTLTLYVLEIDDWPWMFLGRVKCENLFLCVLYLISQLNKLECTHKARGRREAVFQKMQIALAIYISPQNKYHSPWTAKVSQLCSACGSSEKDRWSHAL